MPIILNFLQTKVISLKKSRLFKTALVSLLLLIVIDSVVVNYVIFQWSRRCLRPLLSVQRWQLEQQREWACGVWTRRTWVKSPQRSLSLRSTLKVQWAAAVMLYTPDKMRVVGVFFADENLNVFSPYVSGREWVSVRAMEESSSEIHELGDDGACL